jgi:hypothetical protein
MLPPYKSVGENDCPLIKLAVHGPAADSSVSDAVAACSPAQAREDDAKGDLLKIGALCWADQRLLPEAEKALFADSLEAMLLAGVVDEPSVRAWHAGEDHMPEGTDLTPEELAALRSSCDGLIEKLDEQEAQRQASLSSAAATGRSYLHSFSLL